MAEGQHKFKPETTNGGNCFADCSCGWSGGVYPSRVVARAAWTAHRDGATVPAPIPTEFRFGPPAQGMGDPS